MNIGESLLTRFASGGNKDLLCKYVQNLRPIDVVTDLRSDPADPAQWEPGQMGRIHRDSWLQMRRHILETLRTCQVANVQRDPEYPIISPAWTMSELLLVSAQLNYTDLVHELISMGVSNESASMIWNMIYGPFRDMRMFDKRDVVAVFMSLIEYGAYPPLKRLVDTYLDILQKDRDRIITNSIRLTDVRILHFLIQRLGKPNFGQTLVEHAARFASVEVMKYLIALYRIDNANNVRHIAITTRSLEKYLAIPGHLRRGLIEDIALAFSHGAAAIVHYLLPQVNSFEWLNGALEHLGINATKENVDAVVLEVLKDARFDPRRDLNLLALNIYNPNSKLYLLAFVRTKRVAIHLTREQFADLYEKWKHHDRVGRLLQSIARAALHRPTLEGEPPQKMLKDPMTPFYI